MMSLRLRLLIIIGVSLSVLWGLVAIWMFLDMRRELHSALDDRLAASARMVAALVAQLPQSGTSGGNMEQLPLNVIARDGLACEVSLLRGEIVVQTVARTAQSPGLSNIPNGYNTHAFGGKLWRIYVLEQGHIRIATADRLDLRDVLLRDIGLSVGIPFAVALMVSLVLLWFAIGRGLLPIERIRAALAQQPPDGEIPLPTTTAPPELRPLADTIHRLLERVQDAIARERRFTDDAAHELRTPLTAIKIHLQVAKLAASRGDTTTLLPQTLSSANDGVMRLQTTLDQLLLLARLDARVEHAGMPAAATVGSTVQQVIGDLLTNDDARDRIECRMDAAIAQRQVALPEALLAAALRNLLDNGLKHSPLASTVQLQIALKDNCKIQFRVLDEGPGLSAAECKQAIGRFWRREANGLGSGLGLSIVSAITDSFGGSLTLSPGSERGLDVCLIVPLKVSEPVSPSA